MKSASKRSADGGGNGQAVHGTIDMAGRKRHHDGVAGEQAGHGVVEYGKPNHANAEVDLKVGKRESVKDAAVKTHSGAGPGGSAKMIGRTSKVSGLAAYSMGKAKSGAGPSEPHA